MPRYETLAALVAARAAGEITTTMPLYIDNDNVSMYDEKADEDVFEMHPEDLLAQALDLLGIPHGHV